jgi:hypothetical protein
MSRGPVAEDDFALYRFALFQQSTQRFARRARRLQARDDRRGLLGAQGFGLADALEEVAVGERPFGDAEDLRRAGVGEDDSGVSRRDDQAVLNRPQRATDEQGALQQLLVERFQLAGLPFRPARQSAQFARRGFVFRLGQPGSVRRGLKRRRRQ